ncbi:histone-fold-containing protein [Mycena alexandri]|uniref:Histone H2A n=1 Tax=Mycena alexandri TaxID=1745969 RepID=A0AAD6TCK3_9AGAR|nr:histone-fold-containing protein [Mycena alexandri]
MPGKGKGQTQGRGKGPGGKGKAFYEPQKLRVASSSKAGLQFPVARIRRLLKEGQYAKRVTALCAVYLAAVLEYLVAELLELSGNCARDQGRKRIIPRHILLAIRNDAELDRLLSDAIIWEGGVVPFIHSVLIPDKDKTRAESEV